MRVQYMYMQCATQRQVRSKPVSVHQRLATLIEMKVWSESCSSQDARQSTSEHPVCVCVCVCVCLLAVA